MAQGWRPAWLRPRLRYLYHSKSLASMLSLQNLHADAENEPSCLRACRLFSSAVAFICCNSHIYVHTSHLFQQNLSLMNAKKKGLAFMSDLLRLTSRESCSNVVDEGIQSLPFFNILRAYQIDGIQWLLNLNKHGLSGALCDDMGLGKTITALSALYVSHQRKGIKGDVSIVIAPASCALQWCRKSKDGLEATAIRCVQC